MNKFNLRTIFFIWFINSFIFSNLYSQINNTIVVKVGESLITSITIKNEIITNLVIKRKQISQESIDNNKNFAIKNLINKSIKKSEINKYKIKDYNKKDLQDYIKNVAKSLNTDLNGLRNIFKDYNINYEIFVERHKTELLWNTLIFQIYKNQTNVNIVEVENEVEKIKGSKTDEELKIIKKNILNNKKEEKLSLFSRSHYSNLENTVVVSFQ
jgi:hypothetical protein